MARLAQSFLTLRKPLAEASPSPTWPAGVCLTTLATHQDAVDAHDLLSTAYRDDGGGWVDSFAPWWTALSTDAEYDPALIFLARQSDGAVIGVAHCWASAYVKDLAVMRSCRGSGVGTALLLHIFETFRDRGAAHVDLKVDYDNPNGAQRLYRRLGMLPVSGR